MSDWVHIEPPAPRLTPVQECIREMLRAGKTFRQICVALMMRSDYLRDEIYEIRKYEVLMGEKKRLTDEQKAAIIEMRQAGKPYKEISETVGCSKQTAINVWNAFLHSDVDKPAKKTAINKEFDDAVNEMIAEAAQESEPEPEPVQIPAAVPDAVMDAVRDKIDELQKQVDERAAEIALLNEKIRSLNAWLTEVQA